MKNLLFILPLALLSCKQTSSNKEKIAKDSTAIIDSINLVREKHNDSISALNNKNRFEDLSGSHKFSHNGISKAGKVEFKNIGRDLYTVKGGAESGKNFVKIDGEIKVVSAKYLNFTGEIVQSLEANDNGKKDVRSGTTTFTKKAGTDFWRLQNMQNSSGFADYIDIH